MDIDDPRAETEGWNRQGRELLQAVLARPEVDEPRWVLADWLSQRGDPRGELIALQLADERADRVAQLLEDHRRVWLRPFGSALVAAVFERGFVHRCEVVSERRGDYAGDVWRTVKDLRLRASPVERSPAGMPLRTRGPADFEPLLLPWLDTFRVPCTLFQPTGASAVTPWIQWLREAHPRRVVLYVHAYALDGEDIADQSHAALHLVRDGSRVSASICFPSPEPGAWSDQPLDAYEAALEGCEVDWLGEVWGPE